MVKYQLCGIISNDEENYASLSQSETRGEGGGEMGGFGKVTAPPLSVTLPR